MILETIPLSTSESKALLEKLGEKEELVAYLGKFSKLSGAEAKKLKGELQELQILKLKDEHLAKILDVLPEDALDVHKIFADITLDEHETQKILEIIKKYK